MGDAAMKADQALPAEIADAMETAGFSPKLATLMSIIKEFGKAKAEVKASSANVATAEPMWPLKGLLPLHVDYQKALRAIKSGQLDAVKLDGGGRWFCTERAMGDWLSKTGQAKR